jgi:hypothetical protein
MSDEKEAKSERSPEPGFYWVRHKHPHEWRPARLTHDGHGLPWIEVVGEEPESLAASGAEVGPRIEPPGAAPTDTLALATEAVAVARRLEDDLLALAPKGYDRRDPEVVRLETVLREARTAPPAYLAPPPLEGFAVRDLDGAAVLYSMGPPHTALTIGGPIEAAAVGRAMVAWAEQQKAGGR